MIFGHQKPSMRAITRTNGLLSRNGHRSLSISSVRRANIAEQDAPGTLKEGRIYVDSIFPIRLGVWDIRHLFGLIRQETLLEQLRSLFSSVDLHNFELLSVEPEVKDGGVFARFRYLDTGSSANIMDDLQTQLKKHVERRGGVPSWTGFRRGDVWIVKGHPWREDMNRFPLPLLKVTFEGPDVHEESLYQLFRPYGHIVDISAPQPVPAGTLRSSTIKYSTVRSATIAKNVVYGFEHPFEDGHTRLRTGYEKAIQAHIIREWMAKHPRIVLPILLFLIGTLTYTIFDPIRTIMVEGKIIGWFDYRKLKLWKWVEENGLNQFGRAVSSQDSISSYFPGVWKERSDAEEAVKAYLSDLPVTISFVHGPKGSGKTRMITEAVASSSRKTLTIDCAAIYRYYDSDSRMVAALAQQTGYWPTFTFLNSVNNMIDLASVAVIGQKTGLSVSLADQMKQILEVVTTSIGRVNALHKIQVEETKKKEEGKKQRKERVRRMRSGEWHDGRLDCVAGNGIMSELGIGDERFGVNDLTKSALDDVYQEDVKPTKGNQRTDDEVEAIKALPVVIIRNFEDKSLKKEDVLDVLAQWAAALVESQVAHVIVVSDNRENSKKLAKVLPSKPLNYISLSDADSATALSFVEQKLKDADANVTFTKETKEYVERLGGRASDLETLIYKVRAGSTIEEAVDDIITRGVAELRKNAFGDDAEDAKNLPWSREQAWGLMKRIASQTEIPYHEVLSDFPFKGDEIALRSMEHAELITITTNNGRPSMIRPGKPVYKYVFQRVVQDSVFSATQDIAFNKKLISAQESIISSCEEELSKLISIKEHTYSSLWGADRAVSARIRYLLKKMGDAESKVEGLEKANVRLKKFMAHP